MRQKGTSRQGSSVFWSLILSWVFLIYNLYHFCTDSSVEIILMFNERFELAKSWSRSLKIWKKFIKTFDTVWCTALCISRTRVFKRVVFCSSPFYDEVIKLCSTTSTRRFFQTSVTELFCLTTYPFLSRSLVYFTLLFFLVLKSCHFPATLASLCHFLTTAYLRFGYKRAV